MKKTTVYLTAELKKKVKRLAKIERRSEAELIRDAVAHYADRATPPKPHLPLIPKGTLPPDVAERIDDYMKGFGKD